MFGSGPTPLRGQGGGLEAAFTRHQAGASASGAPPMRLDEFAAKFTSEDNASFLELVAKDNERKGQRALAQYAEAAQQGLLAQRQLLSLEGPRRGPEKTDGYGSSHQPYSTLIAAPQQARNQLYFYKASGEWPIWRRCPCARLLCSPDRGGVVGQTPCHNRRRQSLTATSRPRAPHLSARRRASRCRRRSAQRW